jgi:hypothetical protein
LLHREPPLVLFPAIYKLNKRSAATSKTRLPERSRNGAMKPSVVRKADRLAKERAPEPRMHIFWWELDETREMVQARIRAKIASGEASENDCFVTYTWTRPEG